ncbi:RUS1 family protein C16orf58 homolog isoform X1 [Sarcophilus harrisii]|uniref:RUS family member 1 n=1 Tax=Sarcophilus harrisii TaxID=9305 RepID=A0A7N4UXH2_SARHA|nr:RUS1 family protein C16orf58 homolog isoform X1 [Sarcophilus harrisii]
MSGSRGPAALRCWERFGSGSPRGCTVAPDGSLCWEAGGGPGRGLRTALTAVFLPHGFPDSVSPDYLPYQLWDTVQAFASSLTGSLATQAVLQGVGVGDAAASVSAATITWLLKDGTGMLGRIGFAWLMGSKLDCDAKKWRLFADVLNDAAMFLEIVAPAFPSCFTLIVCVSSLAKCIVGVAGGATRAALTMHQARRDNMADVSAKDGSQETLVNLAGLLVSLLLLPLVSERPRLSLAAFFLFTALHLYANYRAVRAVIMETFNETRLYLVLKHFIQWGEVLTPPSANRMEPLWTGCLPALSLSLGVALHSLVSSAFELQQVSEGHQQPYLLRWNQCRGKIQVTLGQEASAGVILRAATHGLLLAALLEDVPLTEELETLRGQIRAAPEGDSWTIVKETYQILDKLYPKFLKELQAVGWETEHHLLEVDEWRAAWPLREKKIL